MPLAPYTWQTDDYLSASRLNGELRRYNGQPYLGNGVGWHAQRPVYKSYLTANTAQNTSLNTWLKQNFASNFGNWTPVIDSAAFLGGKGDLAAEGSYNPAGLQAGGGTLNSPGGLSLFWTHQPFATAASGWQASGIGAAGAGAGATPNITGTISSVNANSIGCTPWSMSIQDSASNLTGYWETSAPLPAGYVSASGDGSGAPPRQHAMWASVYPANGTTVGSVPTITTGYTGASTLTSTAMNAQIAAAMNLLNMPPLLSVAATGAATLCNTATQTVINYPAATYDTYGKWTSGTNASYSVPLNGLYLVCAFTCFNGSANVGSRMRTGVTINGTGYYGPTTPTMAVANPMSAGKVQIFSLNAGDTIQHVVDQITGTNISTSNVFFSNMTILYLGAQGAPAPLPTVPDFTYLFQAGTPGSQMPSVLNSYLANDLSFLIQRPYTLAYQTTAQAAFGNRSATALQLQSNTGIVHGDSATSYGGYSTSTWNYTAPVSGWYLCVSEYFMASPAATNDYYTGCFTVSPAGAGPDFYEQQLAWNGTGGGASAVGLYYLRAGDVITPCGYWAGATGTLATDISIGKSHFEAVWVSA